MDDRNVRLNTLGFLFQPSVVHLYFTEEGKFDVNNLLRDAYKLESFVREETQDDV